MTASEPAPWLWDVATGQVIRRFEGHVDDVRFCAFSPNGQFVLSAMDNDLASEEDQDFRFWVWDMDTGQVIRRFDGHDGTVNAGAFSVDDRSALSASENATLRLWDVANGAQTRRASRVEGVGEWVGSCGYSPNGLLAFSASDPALRLRDGADGSELRRFEGHTSHISKSAFSPDGRNLLSASSDCSLRLWEVSTGEEIRRFSEGEEDVNDCVFSPDGLYILSVSGNGWSSRQLAALSIWDATTGEKLAHWITQGGLHSCDWSPVAHEVVAGDANGGLHFLEIVGLDQMTKDATLRQAIELSGAGSVAHMENLQRHAHQRWWPFRRR